jgi:DNA (cytosine-5)-methyltransferase 1
LHKLRTLHLFAGAGGGILADMLLGHRPIAAVEIEPYCQQVLHQRQKDGILPWFPIFSDVCEFDGRRFKGLVDIIAGGFP